MVCDCVRECEIQKAKGVTRRRADAKIAACFAFLHITIIYNTHTLLVMYIVLLFYSYSRPRVFSLSEENWQLLQMGFFFYLRLEV